MTSCQVLLPTRKQSNSPKNMTGSGWMRTSLSGVWKSRRTTNMKTEFDVSFEKNGVCQARIVVSKTKEVAVRWFRFIEP